MSSIWDNLEKQHKEIIDNVPDSVTDFRKNTPGPNYLEELYNEAGASNKDGTRQIPLSYHTKACGWAADYPLMYRRVFVFLNPGPLSTLSLDEYILREFGCWRDTFVKLAAEKWIVPTLPKDESAYPDNVVKDIEKLYEDIQDINDNIKPRYVNTVDRFIETKATEADIDEELYRRADTEERVDIDKSITHWKKNVEPWKSLPTTEINELFHGELFGVKIHKNVRDYVTERAVKLRLADETLDIFTESGDSIDNLRTLAEEEGSTRDLVRETYVRWNKFGTPTYYCDLTGSVDMGPMPLQGYTDNFKRSLDRLARRFGAEQFTDHDINPVPNICIPVWLSEEADMDALFRYGPSGIQSLPVRNMYKSLISRADEHQAYVEDMFDNGEKMQGVINEADSYIDLLHIHNETAEAYQTFAKARKIASSFTDGLVAGRTVSSVIDVARMGNSFQDILIDVGMEVAVPGAGSLLVEAGSATLNVPERITVAGPEKIGVKQIQRDDAAYGDIWKLPYGKQNLMRQFQWIGEETLESSLKPL